MSPVRFWDRPPFFCSDAVWTPQTAFFCAYLPPRKSITYDKRRIITFSVSPPESAGLDAVLMRGTAGSKGTTEVKNVKDLTLNMESGEADVTTRATAG